MIRLRKQHFLLYLGLLCIPFALSLLIASFFFRSMPAAIPMHFDIAGIPDGWGHRSVITWFLLNGISFILLVFFLSVSFYIRK